SETGTDAGFIDQLAATYLQSGTVIKPVVRQILASPQFQDQAAYFARYSWPVEFVVRALKEAGWTGFSLGSTLNPLNSMGQELFGPPDAAGWRVGPGWSSTSGILTRMILPPPLPPNKKSTPPAAPAPEKSSPKAVVDALRAKVPPADLDNTLYAQLVS